MNQADPNLSSALVAIDWGTSSFRAALLDRLGRVQARIEQPCGIVKVAPGCFPQALRELLSPWRASIERSPVYACGMVGSRNGWHETRYADCPVTLEMLAREVVRHEDDGLTIHLVPGVAVRAKGAAPDMMRGEETQVLGLDAAQGARHAVLPGTHSKWVALDPAAGAMVDFATYMTGELYDLLSHHSLLARSIEGKAWDDSWFERGVGAGHAHGEALSNLLFSVRSRHLLGDLAPSMSASYLSGLLIGHEFGAARQRFSCTGTLALVGNGELIRRYAQAAACVGIDTMTCDPDAAFTGLFRIAKINKDI